MSPLKVWTAIVALPSPKVARMLCESLPSRRCPRLESRSRAESPPMVSGRSDRIEPLKLFAVSSKPDGLASARRTVVGMDPCQQPRIRRVNRAGLETEDANQAVEERRAIEGMVVRRHADRRHLKCQLKLLLALAQRLLGHLPIRDVLHEPAHSRLAVRGSLDRDDVEQPHDVAIGGDHAVLELMIPPVPRRIQAERGAPLHVVRMRVAAPEVRFVDPLADGIPEDGLGVGANEEELKRLGIGFPDNAAERLDEARKVWRLAHTDRQVSQKNDGRAQAGPRK